MRDSSVLQPVTVAQLVQEKQNGTLLLDIRAAEQFAALHIRGSVQIGLMGPFSSWAAILIRPGQNILLIAEDLRGAQEAAGRLARVGLGHVIGYALADENEWRKQGLALGSILTARCEQLRGRLRTDPPVLIDVRSRAEWLKGHLPGAISMPLLELDPKKRIVDPSKPSLVYCYEGFRATTAISILLREGAGDIGILIDGVEGWSALGLPLELPDTPR